jgi:alpha-tubulin suppressor-like RCC1 family protein
VPVTDSLTRVTQSLEAQTPEGAALVVARAAALGTTASITLLPSAIPAPKSANTLEALCQVRTAGEAMNATGFVVNRVPTSLESTVKVITKGQSLPVGAKAKDANGSFFLPATLSVTDSSLATITAGAITALKKGVTTVTPSSACGVTGTAGGLRVLGDIVPIAGGAYHSLALKSDGTMIAWGDNYFGQLNMPAGLTNVTAITALGYHNLALNSNGTVIGYGLNSDGQVNVPAGLTNVTAIAAGGYHSLALKSNGTVIGWGATTVPTLTDVTAIAAGSFHSLALKSDGTVIAWGFNRDGQATVSPTLANVTAIAAGGFHNLVLKSDGTVIAWGDNREGQSNVPVGLTNVVAIAAGNAHSLALKSDGTIIGWGNNRGGQLNIPNISPLTFMQP